MNLEPPKVVDRSTFQAELDELRVREKAHTREGDAMAAARRRLPMARTARDVFESRRQLIAYYFLWHTGRPAAEQCKGSTWVTTQLAELSYLPSRDIAAPVFCH